MQIFLDQIYHTMLLHIPEAELIHSEVIHQNEIKERNQLVQK